MILRPSLTPILLAVCLSVLLSVWGEPPQAVAFSLVTPASGAHLVAGEQVAAAVDLGTDIGVSLVRYYWYRIGEEPLVEQQARPALVATSASSPPYGGILTVPPEAAGLVRLLAVADVARGRLAGHEEFDEILVDVSSPAELKGIEFEVQKPWRLETLGKLLEVPVVGQFADGVTRRIGGASTGSTYQSSNPAVITVAADGMARVVGNGRSSITVTNGGKRGTLEVLVRSDGEPLNRPPMADAGPDVTVNAGSTVVLNGLGSVDPDGDPLGYEWVQVRGNKVSLLDPNTARASFVAPKVSVKRLFRFSLRVTDMKGPDTVKGGDSLPAYINVWVVP
jgi:hypothetical protein